MAGTYSQIYIQVVFAVSGRRIFSTSPGGDDVFKYRSGFIKNKGHFDWAANEKGITR
jgi:putative transposase